MLRFAGSRAFAAVAQQGVEVFVNNVAVTVPMGSAIIQACEKAGAAVPRFCYHKKLAVAGNCRMCLVEVAKAPKPVASCAVPVAPGMRILTDSPLAKKAREGVMELLLINHPLDCPVCDQGGECDLQDQSVAYGSDRSRYLEPKRASQPLNLGPLIKTTMTRCIHCTRCVRFANEVAGITELGTSGRGTSMLIGTYIEAPIASEMSANIIDLCPVGALTSKPYAFTARPWELKKTETVDVLDAVGSNIRVDSRGGSVMRILPRSNDEVNEDWISDKTRFAYDGLGLQRITYPLFRTNGGEFERVTWAYALDIIKEKMAGLEPKHIAGVAGALCDAESLVAFKDLFSSLQSSQIGIELSSLPTEIGQERASRLLNVGISGIEDSDCILLVGTNPRWEAAVFNTRIRRAWLNGADIGVVGPLPALNYGVEHISPLASGIQSLLDGTHQFSSKLKTAKRPVLIIGTGVFSGTEVSQSEAVFKAFRELGDSLSNGKAVDEEWKHKIHNVLHHAASHPAALELGYKAQPSLDNSKMLFLLGADSVSPPESYKGFSVYIGSHGDKGAHFSDLVLPGLAYTEKSGTYISTEGRVQRTRQCVPTPGEARNDWMIIRAIQEVCKGLEGSLYEDTEGVRNRLGQLSGVFGDAYIGTVPPLDLGSENASSAKKTVVKKGKKKSGKELDFEFNLPITDFYFTDPISRSSRTMAKCSDAFILGKSLDEVNEPC